MRWHTTAETIVQIWLRTRYRVIAVLFAASQCFLRFAEARLRRNTCIADASLTRNLTAGRTLHFASLALSGRIRHPSSQSDMLVVVHCGGDN